jgi:predicted alpha/beta-hydrolase family hydrolase
VFLGFPLHPPKRPADTRGKHLLDVHIPMLFLQGTRDELANLELLEPLVERIGERAALKVIQGADHSFHVLVRSGRNDAEVRSELLQTIADWMQTVTNHAPPANPRARQEFHHHGKRRS